MRKRLVWLGFVLIFEASGLYAQVKPLKVCIYQYDEGYDALRLARQLSSRKLESGAPLAVAAITGKALSSKEEQDLAESSAPFVRVLVTEKNAKVRDAEVERLGCDYDVQVSHDESINKFDKNSPAGMQNSSPEHSIPEQPDMGDRIEYKLRKAGSKKVLSRDTERPRTVFVRQRRLVFDPYILFADQIVKKLNRVN
jgi:hypothetical protein